MSETLDLFVIGGGSGGVRAARIAAGHGAKVAIAEESRYGGTCVIRGCVPKKLFVYASHFSHYLEEAAGYGWTLNGEFDWPTLIKNKDAYIDRLNSIYIKMLNNAGVDVLDGRAVLKSANEVEVNGKSYACKHILIATGGRPTCPDIPGAELAITSNEVFHLGTLPNHITIVGAGYIGAEFTSIFRGLGVQVTLVHHRKEALRGFDDDIRHQVTENLRNAGVELMFETEVKKITENKAGGLHFECLNGGVRETDALMFATGRRPYTEGLGLEEAGVAVGPRGGVLIDEFGKTTADSVYAVGDCTDRIQLTPVAIREGHQVVDNLFAGLEEKRPLDHQIVPTAIFTQPEAASVGLTEAEARAGHNVELYRADFRPLYHGLSGSEERAHVKLIIDKDTRRVLGLHMVGDSAAEIIQATAIAITMGATKEDFDRTLALHPSTAEELVLMRTPSES